MEPSRAFAAEADADSGVASVFAGAVASAVCTADSGKTVAACVEDVGEQMQRAQTAASDLVLEYDPSLITAIGNQAGTGHWICCPCFACAYGDAVLYGVANSHEQYGCGCCTWPGWGGGNSSFRSVGGDQELLREAYDQIRSGKPTVIHVAGPSGEHWICLIGYCGASAGQPLTFGNFIALDPTDGTQIVAGDRYALYGDGCEHISDCTA